MQAANEFLGKIRVLDDKYIVLAHEQMDGDAKPEAGDDPDEQLEEDGESANVDARFIDSKSNKSEHIKSAGPVPNSNEDFKFNPGKRQRSTISQNNSVDYNNEKKRARFDDSKSAGSYKPPDKADTRMKNQIEAQLARNAIMNRNCLK